MLLVAANYIIRQQHLSIRNWQKIHSLLQIVVIEWGNHYKWGVGTSVGGQSFLYYLRWIYGFNLLRSWRCMRRIGLGRYTFRLCWQWKTCTNDASRMLPLFVREKRV